MSGHPERTGLGDPKEGQEEPMPRKIAERVAVVLVIAFVVLVVASVLQGFWSQ